MAVDTSLLHDVVSEPVSLCLRSASIILLSSYTWLRFCTLSHSMQINLLHRIRRCVDFAKVALPFRLGPNIGAAALPKTEPYLVKFLAAKPEARLFVSGFRRQNLDHIWFNILAGWSSTSGP